MAVCTAEEILDNNQWHDSGFERRIPILTTMKPLDNWKLTIKTSKELNEEGCPALSAKVWHPTLHRLPSSVWSGDGPTPRTQLEPKYAIMRLQEPVMTRLSEWPPGKAIQLELLMPLLVKVVVAELLVLQDGKLYAVMMKVPATRAEAMDRAVMRMLVENFSLSNNKLQQGGHT
ncbi:hypothetical protein B0H10DRAFT_1949596 [Mycena sp. CBHHK59/15]|nr:hypothetical protein B0H10DRAFT_1949596 [Mycena sp. CBHHK59/15]